MFLKTLGKIKKDITNEKVLSKFNIYHIEILFSANRRFNTSFFGINLDI